ncbi:MAG: creatininase family protein [Christensenella sp.]|nr:creatininase family protein [Christensenella sp.]
MKRMIECSWHTIDQMDRNRTIVLFPIGSVEQHGWHLPVGTDYWMAEAISKELAQRETDGFEALLFPTLQFGLNVEHAGFCGTITLSAKLLLELLEQQVRLMREQGFRYFAFLNTHGGNTGLLEIFVREFKVAHPDCRMTSFQYFTHGFFDALRAYIENPIGVDVHAGELETSMMQYLMPELVHGDVPPEQLTESNCKSGALPKFWLTREVSVSGVMGDAKLAKPEKGKIYFDYICDSLALAISDFMQGAMAERAR